MPVWSSLAARAGVVTGAVAVTVGATGEGMVAGDAVNTAARVQSAADAGAVLVMMRALGGWCRPRSRSLLPVSMF
ncbi:MAG: hypothetical protein WKF82_04235 [Nocardioidaceae bacterium]